MSCACWQRSRSAASVVSVILSPLPALHLFPVSGFYGENCVIGDKMSFLSTGSPTMSRKPSGGKPLVKGGGDEVPALGFGLEAPVSYHHEPLCCPGLFGRNPESPMLTFMARYRPTSTQTLLPVQWILLCPPLSLETVKSPRRKPTSLRRTRPRSETPLTMKMRHVCLQA